MQKATIQHNYEKQKCEVPRAARGATASAGACLPRDVVVGSTRVHVPPTAPSKCSNWDSLVVIFTNGNSSFAEAHARRLRAVVGPHGSAHAGDALIRSVLSEDFKRTGNDNYLVMQVIHSIFQQLTVTLRIGLFGACLDPNITTAVTSSPIGRAQTLVLGGAGEKPLACEQMPQMSLDDPIAQGLGYLK